MSAAPPDDSASGDQNSRADLSKLSLRGPGRRAKGKKQAKSAPEPSPPAAEASSPPGAATPPTADMFFQKGAASANSFRPFYWTYDRSEETPETSEPAPEATAPSEEIELPRRRSRRRKGRHTADEALPPSPAPEPAPPPAPPPEPAAAQPARRNAARSVIRDLRARARDAEAEEPPALAEETPPVAEEPSDPPRRGARSLSRDLQTRGRPVEEPLEEAPLDPPVADESAAAGPPTAETTPDVDPEAVTEPSSAQTPLELPPPDLPRTANARSLIRELRARAKSVAEAEAAAPSAGAGDPPPGAAEAAPAPEPAATDDEPVLEAAPRPGEAAPADNAPAETVAPPPESPESAEAGQSRARSAIRELHARAGQKSAETAETPADPPPAEAPAPALVSHTDELNEEFDPALSVRVQPQSRAPASLDPVIPSPDAPPAVAMEAPAPTVSESQRGARSVIQELRARARNAPLPEPEPPAPPSTVDPLAAATPEAPTEPPPPSAVAEPPPGSLSQKAARSVIQELRSRSKSKPGDHEPALVEPPVAPPTPFARAPAEKPAPAWPAQFAGPSKIKRDASRAETGEGPSSRARSVIQEVRARAKTESEQKQGGIGAFFGRLFGRRGRQEVKRSTPETPPPQPPVEKEPKRAAAAIPPLELSQLAPPPASETPAAPTDRVGSVLAKLHAGTPPEAPAERTTETVPPAVETTEALALPVAEHAEPELTAEGAAPEEMVRELPTEELPHEAADPFARGEAEVAIAEPATEGEVEPAEPELSLAAAEEPAVPLAEMGREVESEIAAVEFTGGEAERTPADLAPTAELGFERWAQDDRIGDSAASDADAAAGAEEPIAEMELGETAPMAEHDDLASEPAAELPGEVSLEADDATPLAAEHEVVGSVELEPAAAEFAPEVVAEEVLLDFSAEITVDASADVAPSEAAAAITGFMSEDDFVVPTEPELAAAEFAHGLVSEELASGLPADDGSDLAASPAEANAAVFISDDEVVTPAEPEHAAAELAEALVSDLSAEIPVAAAAGEAESPTAEFGAEHDFVAPLEPEPAIAEFAPDVVVEDLVSGQPEIPVDDVEASAAEFASAALTADEVLAAGEPEPAAAEFAAGLVSDELVPEPLAAMPDDADDGAVASVADAPAQVIAEEDRGAAELAPLAASEEFLSEEIPVDIIDEIMANEAATVEYDAEAPEHVEAAEIPIEASGEALASEPELAAEPEFAPEAVSEELAAELSAEITGDFTGEAEPSAAEAAIAEYHAAVPEHGEPAEIAVVADGEALTSEPEVAAAAFTPEEDIVALEPEFAAETELSVETPVDFTGEAEPSAAEAATTEYDAEALGPAEPAEIAVDADGEALASEPAAFMPEDDVVTAESEFAPEAVSEERASEPAAEIPVDFTADPSAAGAPTAEYDAEVPAEIAVDADGEALASEPEVAAAAFTPEGDVVTAVPEFAPEAVSEELASEPAAETPVDFAVAAEPSEAEAATAEYDAEAPAEIPVAAAFAPEEDVVAAEPELTLEAASEELSSEPSPKIPVDFTGAASEVERATAEYDAEATEHVETAEIPVDADGEALTSEPDVAAALFAPEEDVVAADPEPALEAVSAELGSELSAEIPGESLGEAVAGETDVAAQEFTPAVSEWLTESPDATGETVASEAEPAAGELTDQVLELVSELVAEMPEDAIDEGVPDEAAVAADAADEMIAEVAALDAAASAEEIAAETLAADAMVEPTEAEATAELGLADDAVPEIAAAEPSLEQRYVPEWARDIGELPPATDGGAAPVESSADAFSEETVEQPNEPVYGETSVGELPAAFAPEGEDARPAEIEEADAREARDVVVSREETGWTEPETAEVARLDVVATTSVEPFEADFEEPALDTAASLGVVAAESVTPFEIAASAEPPQAAPVESTAPPEPEVPSMFARLRAFAQGMRRRGESSEENPPSNVLGEIEGARDADAVDRPAGAAGDVTDEAPVHLNKNSPERELVMQEGDASAAPRAAPTANESIDRPIAAAPDASRGNLSDELKVERTPPLPRVPELASGLDLAAALPLEIETPAARVETAPATPMPDAAAIESAAAAARALLEAALLRVQSARRRRELIEPEAAGAAAPSPSPLLGDLLGQDDVERTPPAAGRGAPLLESVLPTAFVPRTGSRSSEDIAHAAVAARAFLETAMDAASARPASTLSAPPMYVAPSGRETPPAHGPDLLETRPMATEAAPAAPPAEWSRVAAAAPSQTAAMSGDAPVLAVQPIADIGGSPRPASSGAAAPEPLPLPAQSVVAPAAWAFGSPPLAAPNPPAAIAPSAPSQPVEPVLMAAPPLPLPAPYGSGMPEPPQSVALSGPPPTIETPFPAAAPVPLAPMSLVPASPGPVQGRIAADALDANRAFPREASKRLTPPPETPAPDMNVPLVSLPIPGEGEERRAFVPLGAARDIAPSLAHGDAPNALDEPSAPLPTAATEIAPPPFFSTSVPNTHDDIHEARFPAPADEGFAPVQPAPIAAETVAPVFFEQGVLSTLDDIREVAFPAAVDEGLAPVLPPAPIAAEHVAPVPFEQSVPSALDDMREVAFPAETDERFAPVPAPSAAEHVVPMSFGQRMPSARDDTREVPLPEPDERFAPVLPPVPIAAEHVAPESFGQSVPSALDDIREVPLPEPDERFALVPPPAAIAAESVAPVSFGESVRSALDEIREAPPTAEADERFAPTPIAAESVAPVSFGQGMPNALDDVREPPLLAESDERFPSATDTVAPLSFGQDVPDARDDIREPPPAEAETVALPSFPQGMPNALDDIREPSFDEASAAAEPAPFVSLRSPLLSALDDIREAEPEPGFGSDDNVIAAGAEFARRSSFDAATEPAADSEESDAALGEAIESVLASKWYGNGEAPGAAAAQRGPSPAPPPARQITHDSLLAELYSARRADAPPPEPEPERSSNRMLIIVCVVVGLLAAVGGAVVMSGVGGFFGSSPTSSAPRR